jgi:UDP-glucose 4-epimerase
MTERARVLLVGGAGFIGRHVAARLVTGGREVTVFDRMAPAGVSGVTVRVGDLADPAALDALLVPGGAVVHLAWTTIPATADRDPAADLADNVLGSVRLLEACSRAGVGRVVFLSSGGTVYGKAARVPIQEGAPTEPIGAYGIGKLAVEKYLALYHRRHGLDSIVLRPANAYGPGQDPRRGQSAATVFAHRALRGEPITIWGDGQVVRDYLYVEDLAEAVGLALDYAPGPDGPRLFNVGTGVGTSLLELLELVGAALGRPPAVERAPARPLDVPVNILDSRRLTDATLWRPRVPLAEGLRRMLDVWKAGAGGRGCV